MWELIKIELLKNKYGKKKYILILSSLVMVIIPYIYIMFSREILDKNFINIYSIFIDINYNLIMPISVGVFILSNVCNEFKNKSISIFIMSEYSRSKIIIAKYLVLTFISLSIFILCNFIFIIISYILSDKSLLIYFNYKVASLYDILINLLEVNLSACIYISAVISFCFMLGLCLKKQGVSILIYIVVITFISTVFNTLEGTRFILPDLLFTKASQLRYIGVSGYTYGKIISLLPCISNIFLFLSISDLVIKNMERVMNIMKNYKTTLILFIIAVLLILCNYIIIINFNYKFINNDIIKNNEEIMDNAEELSNSNIAMLSYDDKIDLAYRYYAKEDYTKSKEICEIILESNNTDKKAINLISSIYQQELNFDKSAEYLEILLPITSGIDLYYLYNCLSDVYIFSNIDKSIDYLTKGLELKDKSSFVFSDNEINYINNKLEYFKKLKALKDGEDSFEFFKECLEADMFIDIITKKYLFSKYEDTYSLDYVENFKKLKAIYENMNLK